MDTNINIINNEKDHILRESTSKDGLSINLTNDNESTENTMNKNKTPVNRQRESPSDSSLSPIEKSEYNIRKNSSEKSNKTFPIIKKKKFFSFDTFKDMSNKLTNIVRSSKTKENITNKENHIQETAPNNLEESINKDSKTDNVAATNENSALDNNTNTNTNATTTTDTNATSDSNPNLNPNLDTNANSNANTNSDTIINSSSNNDTTSNANPKTDNTKNDEKDLKLQHIDEVENSSLPPIETTINLENFHHKYRMYAEVTIKSKIITSGIHSVFRIEENSPDRGTGFGFDEQKTDDNNNKVNESAAIIRYDMTIPGEKNISIVFDPKLFFKASKPKSSTNGIVKIFKLTLTRYFLIDQGYIYISEKVNGKLAKVKSINSLKNLKKLFIDKLNSKQLTLLFTKSKRPSTPTKVTILPNNIATPQINPKDDYSIKTYIMDDIVNFIIRLKEELSKNDMDMKTYEVDNIINLKKPNIKKLKSII